MQFIFDCIGAFRYPREIAKLFKEKFGKDVPEHSLHNLCYLPKYEADREAAKKIYRERIEHIPITNAVYRLQEIQSQYNMLKDEFEKLTPKAQIESFPFFIRQSNKLREEARAEEMIRRNIKQGQINFNGDVNIINQINILKSLPDRYLERVNSGEIDVDTARKLYEEEKDAAVKNR